MPECPCCMGEGSFDFGPMDAPLQRLARVFGLSDRLEPMGLVDCDVCDGTGEVTEDVDRDYRAWATARVDQLLAGVDDGSIKI